VKVIKLLSQYLPENIKGSDIVKGKGYMGTGMSLGVGGEAQWDKRKRWYMENQNER
jgi:hypothetical protein